MSLRPRGRRGIEGQIPIGEVIAGEHEPGTLIVGSAEWVDPFGYDNLTDEQKQAMVEQFEAPPEASPEIE